MSFGQVYLSKPINVEKDQSASNIFPHEARLRNLTYSAPLYCDVALNQYDISELDPNREDMYDLGEPETKEEVRRTDKRSSYEGNRRQTYPGITC